MRAKGKITFWDDDKAYGFISPLAGGDRTFVHINAFANRSRRPIVGDVVTYSLSADARGRPRAEAATIAGMKHRPASKPSSGGFPQLLAAAFLLAVGGAALLSVVPTQFLTGYLVLSLVTFAAYGLDKRAASKGAWRTSESTLHVLGLLGGWPGALIAQGQFRHKTSKQSFRTVFRATIILNCAVFAGLVTPKGLAVLHSVFSATG